MTSNLHERLSSAPCIFFDCDGVIFDSNPFKLKAVQAILDDYPRETHAAMLAYWNASGGISRYVKFEHYFREMLGMTADEARPALTRALADFARLSRQGYEGQAPVQAAIELAQALGPSRVVVVSGSDQNELRDVFAQHGLSEMFPSVLGSPTPKLMHVRSQLAARGHLASACLSIGDGPADFEAAQTAGIPFVFLAEMSDWQDARASITNAFNTYYIETWRELLASHNIRNP